MGNNLERLSGEGSPTQGSSSPTRRAAAALTSSWRNASSPDTPTRGSPATRKSGTLDASSPLYASTSLAPPSPSMAAASSPSRSGRGRKHSHEGSGDSNPGSPSPSPPSSFDASLFKKPTRPARSASSPAKARSREGSAVTLMEPFPVIDDAKSRSGSPSSSFHAQSPVGALPANVLARIFSSLSAADLLRCSLVSKEWLVLASMDAWWEELAMKDLQTPGMVSVMLHERTELPHLTHGSWRALYWKYRRKEELTLRPRVVAVYDYRARTDRELDVKRGEVLRLLAEDSATCWWLVQRTEQAVADLPSQPAAKRADNDEADKKPKTENGEDEREDEQGQDGEGTPKEESEDDRRDGQPEEREEGQVVERTEDTVDDEEPTQVSGVGEEELITNAATNEQGLADERHGDADADANELKGRKSATTVGWVPSGYLEHCPRRINPARALRSAAASAADDDAQNGRQPERNKKLPFMVRANFDYVGANAQELSFKKYDLMAVDLHPKEKYPVPFDSDDDDDDEDQAPSADGTDGKIGAKAGWWKASLTRRSTTGGTTTVSGWIPANLVTEEVTHVIALFEYMPASDEELPLKKGQRVAVLATDENRKGWIYAQGNGRRGWLPENYVVDDDDA